MTIEYIDVKEAIARNGLRMVVVGNVPSPWGEAAKGLFHMKGLDWAAVRLVYDDPALAEWAGQLSGPVAVYNDDPPRSGWAEILLLAERLAPEPAVIPADPERRAQMFGVCHELLGEEGLAWSRRLHLVHLGLNSELGFAPQVAQYLAGKYGHTPEMGLAAGQRTIALLTLFAARLQNADYLMGDAVTAADVYLATTMALFSPLSEDRCAMNPTTRAAFEARDAATAAALDPVLLAHRDRMYAEYLEPVLSL